MNVLLPNAAYSDDGGESGGEGVATEGGARVHGAHYLHSLQPHPLQLLIMEPSICQHLQHHTQNSTQPHTATLVHTCWRKAMSWLVPHLSGLGRLRSLRKRMSLSQSRGLYTRPVLVEITIQTCTQ